MRNCTLFVSIKEYSKIMSAIMEVFRDKTVQVSEDGFKIIVTNKKLFGKYNVTFSLKTDESEKENLKSMIKGMFGYFHQIQTNHQKIKEKLLLQISALNAAVGIVSEKEMDKDMYTRILDTAARINGVVFMPSGEMLDRYGRVILNPNGDSEVDDFIPTVNADLIDSHIKVTKSGEERKKRSIKLLQDQGIPFIEGLPVIVGDEDAVIRSKEEIVKRAVALCIVALYAGGLADGVDIKENGEFIEGLIEQYGAEEFFTQKEKIFIKNHSPNSVDIVQFAWMYECYWVLLWALGYVDELGFPENICDVKRAVSYLKNAGDYETFFSYAVVRKKEEILDQADLIYRYDWACVDARINNRPVPGGLNDEVVVERHRALNWLVNYLESEWDEVRTDT
ncbi:MAG: DUF4272 domain-containing protein [Bacillota bacterium]